MKSIFFIILLGLATLSYAQDSNIPCAKDSVILYEQWENVYGYHDLYVSGQPDMKLLKWYKEQGVTKIINFRSKSENKEFSKESFNEKRSVEKMGMEYYSIPVSGNGSYTPQNLQTLISYLSPEDKVVMHCQGGGRASQFMIAYLIKGMDLDANTAVKVGRQMKFSLPFENILGVEIQMKMPDDF